MAQLSPAAQNLFDALVQASGDASTSDDSLSKAQADLVNDQQAVITQQAAVNAALQDQTTKHKAVADASTALIVQLSKDYGFPLPPELAPPAPTPPVTPPSS